MTTRGFILSFAHEVVQCVPLSDNLFTCMRCGMKGSLHRLFYSQADEDRCTPHVETATSGWADETWRVSGAAEQLQEFAAGRPVYQPTDNPFR